MWKDTESTLRLHIFTPYIRVHFGSLVVFHCKSRPCITENLSILYKVSENLSILYKVPENLSNLYKASYKNGEEQ